MAIQFHPTRNEVSRAFPMLGFTVRTGADGASYEVALATDASLLPGSGRGRRTRDTFWSSRPSGRITAPRGESVFIVPPEVLARFAGKERLYYGIAVYAEADPGHPEVKLPPASAAPYVVLSKSYDGRTRRLGTGARSVERGGYGQPAAPEALSWAADEAAPGTLEPIPRASAPAGTAPVPTTSRSRNVDDPVPSGTPSAPAAAATLAYSDGLGDDFWRDLEAEVEAGDEAEVGPIPDTDDTTAAPTLVQGLDSPVPEDPYARRFAPAATTNYRVSTGRTIRRVVIHITDGGSRTDGTVGWFQNPQAKVSAHYVIGQDGEIVQMVRHGDVAWHAGSANADSIGIEHVANTRGLLPTQAQYAASAQLVRWLCAQYDIACDREHVLGHHEADPHTTHRACPDAVWSWDTYLGLLTGTSDAPAPHTAQALEGSMDLYYADVELVPQPTTMSCWAAAVTMVYGWTHRISLDPRTIAEECQRIDQLGAGLPWSQRDDLAQQLGLTFVWPQSYTVQGFYDLLHSNGPLYVGRAVPSGHAVCVVGLHGDGTPENTTVIFHDPWPPDVGAANSRLPFTQFMREYENAAAGDENTPAFPQIMHGNGRRQSATLSLGLGGAQPASEMFSGYQPAASSEHAYNGSGGGTATLVRPAESPAVAVGGAVAGAVAGAIFGNNGDVSWQLGQFTGPHYPGGNRAKAGTGAFRRSGPVTVRAPRGSTFGGTDEIYADFEVSWEQNGRSIGAITIAPSPGGSNDAAGAALEVRATITPLMTELAGPATNPTQTQAAVQVQFQYAFTYAWASNVTAVIDMELHGDGTYSTVNRW